MAETKKLMSQPESERDVSPGGPESRQASSNPTRSKRVLVGIIGVAAIWLLMMTGSIWFSAVPQAGLKAGILLGVGTLFLGGWSSALLWRLQAADKPQR